MLGFKKDYMFIFGNNDIMADFIFFNLRVIKFVTNNLNIFILVYVHCTNITVNVRKL